MKFFIAFFLVITVFSVNAQSADEFYESGIRNMENGSYRAAVKDFSRAIELDPLYIEAWTARGDSWEELNSKHKANENWSQAYYLMANDRFQAGATLDACKYWALAVSLGHIEAKRRHEENCITY